MQFEDTSKHLQTADELLDHVRELSKRGLHTQAEDVCMQILQSVVSLYGSTSLKAFDCIITLADVNYAQRKYEDVMMHLQQILFVNAKEEFLTVSQILTVNFKLGRALEKCGNFKEAFQLYRNVLKGAQENLGPNASFTRMVAESLRSLSERYSEGLPEAKEVLEEIKQFDSSPRLVNVNKLREREQKRSVGNGVRVVAMTVRRRFSPILSVTLASMFCLWFTFSGTFKNNNESNNAIDATAALKPSAPGQLSVYAGSYSSTDGRKTLTLNASNEGVFIVGGKENPIEIKKEGAELYAEPTTKGGTAYMFRTSGQGLIDPDGTKLFRTGAPELETVGSMKEMADVLNQFYRAKGHYPRSIGEIQSMGAHLRFVNSSNNEESFPRYKQIATKHMTISDYSTSNQLAASILAYSENKEQPGVIELFAFPETLTGDTVIVRGYDRTGSLLSGSTSGRCFSLTLTGGATTM